MSVKGLTTTLHRPTKWVLSVQGHTNVYNGTQFLYITLQIGVVEIICIIVIIFIERLTCKCLSSARLHLLMLHETRQLVTYRQPAQQQQQSKSGQQCCRLQVSSIKDSDLKVVKHLDAGTCSLHLLL